MYHWLLLSLWRTDDEGHGAMCALLSRTQRDMSGRLRGEPRRVQDNRWHCRATSTWHRSWLQARTVTSAGVG